MTIADDNMQAQAAILASHEAQIKIVSDRVGNVENKIDLVINDLHRLSNIITSQAARPSFDIVKIITVTKDIGLSIGLVVAAIVYITGSSFSAQFHAVHTLQQDLNELRQELRVRDQGRSTNGSREFSPG